MDGGARTPEELETLLEDALIMGDAAALRRLFTEGGVLATAAGAPEGEPVAARAAAPPAPGAYVGGPRRVLRARDTALVVCDAGIHVARRGPGGAWRLAISVLNPHDEPRGDR